MHKHELAIDIEKKLQELNVSYRYKRSADFEIFLDKNDENNEENLLYLGLLLIKEKEKTIKLFEKNKQTTDLDIIGVIQPIAQNHGYIVQSVIEKNEASYPIYIALLLMMIIWLKNFFKHPVKSITQWIESLKQLFQRKDKESNQKKFILISLAGLILIVLIIISIPQPTENEATIAPPGGENEEGNNDQPTIDPPTEEEPNMNSSKVSVGVNPFELGNIASGQFYFETESKIFYSCYDEENNAHIYAIDKDTNSINEIFDGFGWSLVVYEDKLYFSGNSGAKIDGTYHLYRMNLDGTQLEKLVSAYTYNMFFYGTHLYYVKMDSDILDVYRMDIATLVEEQIIDNGKLPVIYNHQLYYLDNLGNLYRSDPNGQNKEVLAYSVSFFVISDNKIIYYDIEQDFYYADLDGTNQTLIYENNQNISTFNFSENTIYYIVNGDALYTSERIYTIHSIGLDGTNHQEIMTITAYLLYTNVINQRIYAFIYTLQTIYIETLSFDGLNRITLDR